MHTVEQGDSVQQVTKKPAPPQTYVTRLAHALCTSAIRG